MKTMKTWVAAAAMVALSGTAYAAPAFQGRLADGEASATCTVSGANKCAMFYYTTLDITILNDWSIGMVSWSAAQALAETAGGAQTDFTGWSLPTGDGDQAAGPLNQYSSIWNAVGGSLAGLQNQFDGVQSYLYWSSTPYEPYAPIVWVGGAWFFYADRGWLQPTVRLIGEGMWAVAVRPGDVASHTAVSIDIMPGSFPNSIDPRSEGVVPVAILSTNTFDATTVDPASVHFVAVGTEAIYSALEDVDHDGYIDMILHFRTQDTGIICGTTSASLKGSTFGGQMIKGTDSVTTVGCEVFQGRLADGTASATCTVSGANKCAMFYNRTLDITILNDWNIGTGSWSAAQALAETAGDAQTDFTGWYLPTGGECCGPGEQPPGPLNQYSSIWNDVGRSLEGLRAQFDGVQYNAYYWSANAFSFWTVFGDQYPADRSSQLYAVAVRPGDVTSQAPAAVSIDIKPGGFPNSINLSSKGVVSVAILSTNIFNALTADPASVHFGAVGTEATPLRSAMEDVDHDGVMDMIFHFNTQDTGIVCGTFSASLKGSTFGGKKIKGTDSVKTVGCK